MPSHPILTRARFEAGLEHLRRVDPRFGAWIDRMIERMGRPTLRYHPDRFTVLARAIIAQQLSAKAARTIHARLRAHAGVERRLDPRRVIELEETVLRGCGLSARKAASLRTLAEAFDRGPLRRARLQSLDDEAVVERLITLPGIGRWTAEIFLLFALRRPDVFAIGDAALRASASRVAGRPLDEQELLARAATWAPHRSVASLCLWRLLELRD